MAAYRASSATTAIMCLRHAAIVIAITGAITRATVLMFVLQYLVDNIIHFIQKKLYI